MSRHMILTPLAVLICLCCVQSSFGETTQEMFDRFVTENNYPLYRGPQLYARLKPLTKAELLVGRTHSNFVIRECSLLILKKSHLAALNQDDLKAIALSLDDSTFQSRDAAADLLGSHAEGKSFLTDAIRATSNEKAVSAGVGILKNPEGFSKEIRTQALQRILDCLGRCDIATLGYLYNNTVPEAIPWLKKTMFDETVPENVSKVAANVYSHMATAEDVSFLMQMLQNKRENVRYAAIIRLREFPSDDVTQELLKHIDEPQNEIRRWVYIDLCESNNPIVIPALMKGLHDTYEDTVITSIEGIKKLGAKKALPDLITLVEGKIQEPSELNRIQVMAGMAVAQLTDTKYAFGMGNLCHNAAMEAASKISAGKMLNNEEGQKLIAEGEKELASFKEVSDTHVAMNNAKNIAERRRLLEWWRTEGSKHDF